MCRYLLAVLVVVGLVACGGEDKEKSVQEQTKASAAINLPASSIVIAGIKEVRPSFEYPAVVEAVQLARVRPEISAVLKSLLRMGLMGLL